MGKCVRIMSHALYCPSSFDCNAADYDDRTPLHLAAAEGHLEVCDVFFFLCVCAKLPPASQTAHFIVGVALCFRSCTSSSSGVQVSMPETGRLEPRPPQLFPPLLTCCFPCQGLATRRCDRLLWPGTRAWQNSLLARVVACKCPTASTLGKEEEEGGEGELDAQITFPLQDGGCAVPSGRTE